MTVHWHHAAAMPVMQSIYLTWFLHNAKPAADTRIIMSSFIDIAMNIECTDLLQRRATCRWWCDSQSVVVANHNVVISRNENSDSLIAPICVRFLPWQQFHFFFFNAERVLRLFIAHTESIIFAQTAATRKINAKLPLNELFNLIYYLFSYFCSICFSSTAATHLSTRHNMEVRKMIAVTVLATIAIILMQTPSTTACSCMPEHAQTFYCKSDYGKWTCDRDAGREQWEHQISLPFPQSVWLAGCLSEKSCVPMCPCACAKVNAYFFSVFHIPTVAINWNASGVSCTLKHRARLSRTHAFHLSNIWQ